MVGLGSLSSPGLEEGGQANQRCSVRGSGLSELGEHGQACCWFSLIKAGLFSSLGSLRSLQTSSACLETSVCLEAMMGRWDFQRRGLLRLSVSFGSCFGGEQGGKMSHGRRCLSLCALALGKG